MEAGGRPGLLPVPVYANPPAAPASLGRVKALFE